MKIYHWQGTAPIPQKNVGAGTVLVLVQTVEFLLPRLSTVLVPTMQPLAKLQLTWYHAVCNTGIIPLSSKAQNTQDIFVTKCVRKAGFSAGFF